MSEIHAVLPKDSVKIITGRDEGPITTQIPVRLILGADDVFRWCRENGLTLTISLIVNPATGPGNAMVWAAECGGIRCWDATPWSAVKRLADQLEASNA